MAEEPKEKWLNYIALTTVILAVCATLSTFKGACYSAFVNFCFDEKESFMDARGWHRVDRLGLICQWFSIVLLTN